jgi:hypothetical protein
VFLAGAATTAHADVTVNTTTSGKASFINVGGDGVTQIRGTRQRIDNMMGGKTQSMIIDIDGRRFVDIDAKKKSATVTPLASIADELEKVGIGAMNATLTKTAQTKQIAGFPCTVHDINLSLPFSPTGQSGQGMDLTMVLTGTVCLSTTVPGLADYQNFYKAAADSGFIFGDPRSTKSPREKWPKRAWRWRVTFPSTPRATTRWPACFRNSRRATSPRRSRRSLPATCPRMVSRFPPATR